MQQDDVISLEKQLEKELKDILHLKDLKDQEIKELINNIERKKEEVYSTELTLAESTKIARETENTARLKAERLLADAEAVVVSRKAQINIIEQEIADLKNELDSFNQLFKSGNVKIEDREPVRHRPEESDFDVKVKGLKLKDSSIYTIKLVSFINARHFVSFGQKAGPVHSHSWQIQIEVKVPAENTDMVAFAKIFEAIKSVLAPFDSVVLNDVHPFNRVQPTTENIALYLFNRLEDAMLEIGLGLGKVSVWETPTRGIEVENRYPDIDALIAGSKVEEVSVDKEEVAAAGEHSPAFIELTDSQETGVADQTSPGLPETIARRRYSFRLYAASFAIITLVAFLAYYSVLFPPPERHYPWGSDSWGHLFKAEYLYNEILKGNYYPQFTEYWYNGSQPFRYWAPLPYYVLAFIRAVTGDIFIAGNLFVVFCALLGGLSWLFLAGRMGLWPATMAGAIWVVWLDNVRVAFLEGNLPRVLATALLPLIFVLFLNVLEKRKSFAAVFFTVVLIHLAVICHAMIAAVYCLCLTLFAFFLWVFRGCGLNDFLRGILALTGGIATAAWWLLPSMTGGITDIDPEAVKNSILFVPVAISLNPLYRFENHLTFYWGTSILIAVAATLYSFRSKPPWAKSLAICGIILVLITFPVFRLFYITLPLSHLLWPLRFSSFAALAILASSLTFNLPEWRQRLLKSSFTTGLLIAGLFAVIFTDCLFSVRLLAYTVSKSPCVMMSAEILKTASGWRVATIDLGRLDSVPSFLFSDTAKREQVFGWAWQGAVTSNNIMLLNTGLEMQFYPFLFRSCVYLGATDLIVYDKEVKDPQAFNNAALRAGYRREVSFEGISIWRGLERPYLIEKQNRCLVAGKYAGVLALQFPEVEMGFSKYIDDYQLEYLKKYPVVIFTGAEWRSKTKAEEIVTSYAAAGGRVFIDLSGMPKSVLSKQPEFLGVYGEAVTPRERLSVFGGGRNIFLQPFSQEISLWRSYVPLLLDKVELEFTYYGNQAPVFGYKLVGGHKIGFLGGNIAYHSFLTGDLNALYMMRDIFGLKTDYTLGPVIPLTYYQASTNGYVMGYQAERNIEAIVPVAAMEGIRVEVDGVALPWSKFENLLLLNLPAGRHEIIIYLVKTPVYRWGAALSIFSIVIVLTGFYIYNKKNGWLAK
ncbi:MAG: 6-pyruvoyl-tetrahydropterin synthase-related protein [Bacillota bacterium]